MRHERGLLTLFQSLDFITLQGITAASVYKRFHSMCNGANLAYEKSAFIEVNGFEGIDSIPTGDDMLLMHKIYMRYPEQVFYLKSKEAIVQTEPEYSWKSFFNQRIRWASKADRYQDRRIIAVLALVYAVNVCFLVLGIASFWKSTWFFFFCHAIAGQDPDRISVRGICSAVFWSAAADVVLSSFAAIAYCVHDHCRLAGPLWFIYLEGQEIKRA